MTEPPSLLSQYNLATLRGRLNRVEPVDTRHDSEKRAAVSVVLHSPSPEDEVSVLFIRRAECEGDPWSGHMAFPGGRRDAEDPDLLATALRETHEEVGLDLATHAEFLVRMPDVPANFRAAGIELTVAPFVFALRGEHVLAPNHEVAETLWVPLRALAAGEGAGAHAVHYEGREMRFPCIRVGERVIWGLTWWMLQAVLREIHRECGVG